MQDARAFKHHELGKATALLEADISKYKMVRQKPASPYFTSVHLPLPSHTLTPISSTTPNRYIRKQYPKSTEMVNFAKLDTSALIEAAIAPSTSQPTHQPKTLTSDAHEEPKTFGATSRKRPRRSDQEHLSENSLSGSESSDETFITRPTKKKRRQPVYESDEDYDLSQRRMRNKSKGRASATEPINYDDNNNDTEEDDAADFQPVKSAKSTSASRKSSTPSRKVTTTSKPRKSVGIPVPTNLGDAHPADKELFRMKTDGKPWKQIKPVWEKLMGKSTGDSTLSVRYCKMKDNFEKAGGKDDIRILKLKAKVEAELEADKWERIARMTEDDGGQVMTAKEVRRRFKEIEKNGFHVSTPDRDDGVSEGNPADMDPVDRELAGLGDGGSTGDLTDLETSDVDNLIDFEGELSGVDSEVGGLTEAEQKLIESFEEVADLEDAELKSNGRPTEVFAAEEGELLDEGNSKLGQEDPEERNDLST